MNYEKLACAVPQRGLVPLFHYTYLSRSVEIAEMKCMATLEAALEGEMEREEGEMALDSQIPVASHLLIKHQKEHTCFFPSVATAISSTSVSG